MGADFRLSVAKHPSTFRCKPGACGCDVVNFVADMVDTAGGVLIEEALDRTPLAKRIQQFDLGVGQLDENHCHTMVRQILRLLYTGAQGVPISANRSFQIRNRDGHMV